MPAGDGRPGDPVIILSYQHSGAASVQETLSADDRLACTSATGILPLCEAAARAWRRVDDSEVLSGLAISSIRAMVRAQISVILAARGKRRWCELATSPPSAASDFREVFPGTRFVCVHRSCTEVIADCVRARPWGPAMFPGMARFSAAYPGNFVAAIAAFWAASTEGLLTFEAAGGPAVCRVRYEDVVTGPGRALAGACEVLGLDLTLADPGPAADSIDRFTPGQVPPDMIPAQLRERVDRLHAQLGYDPEPPR